MFPFFPPPARPPPLHARPFLITAFPSITGSPGSWRSSLSFFSVCLLRRRHPLFISTWYFLFFLSSPLSSMDGPIVQGIRLTTSMNDAGFPFSVQGDTFHHGLNIDPPSHEIPFRCSPRFPFSLTLTFYFPLFSFSIGCDL